MSSKASLRTSPTPLTTIARGEGFNRAKKLAVSQSPVIDNISPPPKARRALLRNTTAGGNIIRLNFDSNPVGQYWELQTTDAPIEIIINKDTIPQ